MVAGRFRGCGSPYNLLLLLLRFMRWLWVVLWLPRSGWVVLWLPRSGWVVLWLPRFILNVVPRLSCGCPAFLPLSQPPNAMISPPVFPCRRQCFSRAAMATDA